MVSERTPSSSRESRDSRRGRVRWTVVFALLGVSSAAAAGTWRALLSPGPVSKGHVAVEGKCDTCHLVFKGIPDEKCLRCHSALANLRELKAGFHFKFAKEKCIDCHVDHKGRDAASTNEKGTRLFDHNATRFPLSGAHQDIKCDYCHDKPLGKMGSKCATCHEDPHKSKLGTSCDKCHNNTDWKGDLRTLADHAVPMDGGHDGLTCQQCHESGKHLAPKVACASCHESSHGGTKADCSQCHQVSGFKPGQFNHEGCTCKFPGKHRTFDCLACHEGFKFTDTPKLCSGCHAKQLTHEPLGECSLCHSALSWKKKGFDHNKRSQFKLQDAHLEVDCSRCHFTTSKTKKKFRGVPKDCEGCHAAEGEAMHGDFGPCAQCHVTAGFDKPTFDHASTGFALTGKHGDTGCQDCHATKTKGYPSSKSRPKTGALFPESGVELASMGFDLLAKLLSAQHAGSADPAAPACGHCHEDPHKSVGKTDCAGCHQTEAWRPSTFGIDRHAKLKFALEGAHGKADCNLCHTGGQLGGLPTECAGCHVDIHQGKFGSTCNECHSLDAFKPVPNFDHGKTGFTLTGAHDKAACATCHGGGKVEDLTARKNPKACATCHELGHGIEVGDDCAKCHAPTDASFTAAKGKGVFDHRKTGFGLERRHTMLKCGQCHPASGPAPVARCANCHLDPHAAQNSPACEDCHRADRWRLARFDHDAAGWPLRGRHFLTPCASCHTNQRWVGLPTDCFDCHALDAMRAAQSIPQPHQFARTDCRDCHFSFWRWR